MSTLAKLDKSTDFGRVISLRLDRDIVAWMTTIGAKSQTPQPTIIWYYWNGTEFLVFSEPDKPKLKNIAKNPNVAVNLQSQTLGEEFAVFTGEARYDKTGPTEDEWAGFVRKYAAWLPGIGHTAESYLGTWSELIRITPTHVRGFV